MSNRFFQKYNFISPDISYKTPLFPWVSHKKYALEYSVIASYGPHFPLLLFLFLRVRQNQAQKERSCSSNWQDRFSDWWH